MGQKLTKAFETLGSDSQFTGEDLLELRRALYEDGVIDVGEVRHILKLHREGVGGGLEGWAGFFVEAIADHFALQREVPDWGTEYKADYDRAVSNVGRVFVNAARAITMMAKPKGAELGGHWTGVKAPLVDDEVDALIAAFEAEGGLVLDALERRVLARLFDRAVDYPERLKRFALEAVFETVRADGVVDADEVGLLRRVLYGPSGDEGIVISRDEAELLLALRALTHGAHNTDDWPEFFAKAVGCHVLLGGALIDEVDQIEAAWLADRLGDPKALDVAGRRLLSHLGREARRVAPEFESYAFAA